MVTSVNCAETTEPIETLFGARELVEQRISWGPGPDPVTGRGTLGGYTWACPDLPADGILNLIH